MTTKHDNILIHIKSLSVGTKISVRKIAEQLRVSEGTAYRAIKEAENIGLVNTAPRVGTIRIENVEKKNIEKLTFAEVVNIVDGTVLGGRQWLNKTLSKFLIGAMTIEEMKKYISSGDLLIVGNREECYELALENNCAVLITGGFSCSDSIKQIAEIKQLPIITSIYDTFTIATMINKAIFERMIKKDILLVEDIMVVNPLYINTTATLRDYKCLFSDTGHSRFPVVNNDKSVVGMITSKDITDIDKDVEIFSIMTKNPITISKHTSVAYAAHIMIWEGIELIPVVEDKALIAVISRQDVMKALQYMRSQPQVGEILEDMILNNFTAEPTEKGMIFVGDISPIMLSHIGTASWGVLNMLMSTAGIVAIKKQKHVDIAVDSFSVYYIKPIQLEDSVEIVVNIIDSGRNFCKVELSILYVRELVAKGMLSANIIRK